MQTAPSGAQPGAGTGTPAPATGAAATTTTAPSGAQPSAGTATPPAPRLGIGNGRTNGPAGGLAPGNGAAPQTGTTADDLDDDDGGDPGIGHNGGPAWGDNWRDGLAKGDAARLKRLERYATPDAVADALFAAQDRIRQGGRAPVLPEDATEDEVKAFRKAHGIPEKAADYGLAWPEGHTPTEADKAALGTFAEFMHARHVPPSGVKAAFEWYTAAQAEAQAAQAEQAYELTQQNIAELRRAYPGREYKRNLAIAEEFLSKHFDGREEALDMVLNAQLPNGLQVRNFAPFLMGLVDAGRANADEEALIGGDGAGGGKTLDAEYKELVDKSASTRLSADENKRLMELAEARQRRAEKQGGRSIAA